MLDRNSGALVVLGSMLAAFSLLASLPTHPVSAQCGSLTKSTCFTCHAQEHPVADNGEWHIIHAEKDACINCHGGNGAATDKELAHQGLVSQPLNDIYTDCHACHPDYEARAERFAGTLGLTPGSCPTPTAAVVNVVAAPPSVDGVLPVNDSVQHPSATAGFIAGALVSLVLFSMAACLLDHGRIH